MRPEFLSYLVCPKCQGDLRLAEGADYDGSFIITGQLQCPSCSETYPIAKGIPRFVPIQNYASSFGYQWLKHARTQYDSYSGANISEKRFFEETRWERDLSGQIILEVGCGSGRFTEQAVSTGATVISCDYSAAVEANYQSHGQLERVLIVQADLYHLPFKRAFFDKLFCFGVLQHLPDPRAGFLSLPQYLKPGGQLAVDVYRKQPPAQQRWNTKYWVRPLTKRIEPNRLYRYVSAYVKFMWPILAFINRIPYGRRLTARLLVMDYRGYFALSDAMHREWAILDTFDMLSPAYDYSQTLETFQQWFADAGLYEVDVHYGYNGIEGRGRRAV